ncbi:Protein archease [Orchesella cincta]|uniref:Protein archease n=1 Tax=Orchesella cincta TaxID=48709 RepID=A0A1D2N3Y2_ORCCI|nr:Protein archease [Orchesella cincta]
MFCNENNFQSPSPSSSPKAKRFKMDSGDAIRTAGNLKSNDDEPNVADLEGEPEDSNVSTEQPPAVELQLLPPIKYEYLDHTADVQIHAWGENLGEAFEQCAMGMFAYITDMDRVDNFGSEQIEATGHDMLSLLYGFLDEWLFLFNAEPYFVARKINITSFDRDNFKISAVGYGETFDLRKHTQGTEVKAITYSNMQFHEKDNYAEVFVIIDI